MITVGEVLKKQRLKLDRSIEEASLDTKIQSRFLRFIEEDNLDKFDSTVYAQGFIKIYAKYLGLDEDRILAIYRRTMPNGDRPSDCYRETGVSTKKFRVTPKAVAIALSALFLLSILSYIGYQIYQFQSPPQIDILTPESEITLDYETVEVSGSIDNTSSLYINDNPVPIDENGKFLHSVTLNPGVNLITVLAKKNNSTQESIETLKITYKAPEEQDIENEESQEIPNILKLETVNSSVWVQLNIDQINQLSQIVQAGEIFEYEVKEQFSFTTGIPSSTKIYFNDKQLEIPTGGSSVGSLECEITNEDQIQCQ